MLLIFKQQDSQMGLSCAPYPPKGIRRQKPAYVGAKCHHQGEDVPGPHGFWGPLQECPTLAPPPPVDRLPSLSSPAPFSLAQEGVQALMAQFVLPGAQVPLDTPHHHHVRKKFIYFLLFICLRSTRLLGQPEELRGKRGNPPPQLPGCQVTDEAQGRRPLSEAAELGPSRAQSLGPYGGGSWLGRDPISGAAPASPSAQVMGGSGVRSPSRSQGSLSGSRAGDKAGPRGTGKHLGVPVGHTFHWPGQGCK